MFEKIHEFEKGRRIRNFRLGLFVGVVSVVAVAATVYVIKKAVEEKIDELQEEEVQEEVEDAVEEAVEEAVLEEA